MDLRFAVDLALIARCLGGLLWGIGWACFIQFNRMGQFLARERTWITVVVGVGVDLGIALGGGWVECAAVIACSAVGIVTRSLVNESRAPEPALNAYRTKWQMEDTIDRLGDITGMLEAALTDDSLSVCQARVSRALVLVHQAQRLMTKARYGEDYSRRSR